MENMNKIHTIILSLIFLVIVIICFLGYFIQNKSAKEIIKPTYSAYIKGDITGDGEIGINDVSRLYRGYKGIITLTDDEKNAGDVVQDGNIGINDVSRLYRYHKGVISELVIINSKVTSLSYISQLDYSNLNYCISGYNIYYYGCGPTSFAMIARAYSDSFKSYSNDQIMKEVRDVFCDARGWTSYGATHSSLFYNSKVLEHFGLNYEMLFRYEYDGFWSNTMKQDEADKIFNAVKNEGKSVILGMPGHWATIGPNPECASDEVYFYNPSSRSQTKCYTMQGLYNVTYDHKGTCSTNGGMCGWALAIAFWS